MAGIREVVKFTGFYTVPLPISVPLLSQTFYELYSLPDHATVSFINYSFHTDRIEKVN